MRMFKLLMCAFAMSLITMVSAQDQTPIAVLSFMNAEDGDDYVEMETRYWKPLHEKMVKDGKMLGWYVYEVVSPYNEKRGYTHMTVNVMPSWNSLEQSYEGIDKAIMAVHKNVSIDEIFMRTEKSRSMVKQEYWMRQDGIVKEGLSSKDVKYVVIDWMDVHPGHRGDYMEMESQVYKPVHQTRVDGGHILTWGLFERIDHYSDKGGYASAATSASYASWADMWNSYPKDAWKTVYPNKNQADIYNEMRKHRTMLGSTVLRLVDYVEAGQ